MPEINVNGEVLHYERAGSGPPLLFVHSLGAGAWMWRREIEHWKHRFDVIAFDARGHGKSTHHGIVSVHTIAEDLGKALQAMHLRRVHAIAISMGGPICAHMSMIDPGTFASLVIVDSFACQGSAGEERARLIGEVLANTSMAEYGATYAKGTIHPESPPFIREELASSVASMDKTCYLEIASSVFTADVANAMRKIDVPVMVVVGADDTRTPVRYSEEIVHLIKDARLCVIDGAAHLSNLDKPNEFHAVIDDFFNRIIMTRTL